MTKKQLKIIVISSAQQITVKLVYGLLCFFTKSNTIKLERHTNLTQTDFWSEHIFNICHFLINTSPCMTIVIMLFICCAAYRLNCILQCRLAISYLLFLNIWSYYLHGVQCLPCCKYLRKILNT